MIITSSAIALPTIFSKIKFARLQEKPPSVELTPAQKPFLFATDMDDSLVPWIGGGSINVDSFQRTRDAVNQVYPTTNINMNTGGDLGWVKHVSRKEQIKPVLHQMPLDFMSLEGGKQLFFNDLHKPADEWIESLKEEDQVPTQTSAIIQNASELIGDKLRNHGFKKCWDERTSDGYNATVYSKSSAGKIMTLSVEETIIPASREIRFMPRATAAERQEQEALCASIQRELQADIDQEGVLMEVRKSESTNWQNPTKPSNGFSLYFRPNKAAAVADVLKRMDNPQAVITVGDSARDDTGNDVKTLATECYTIKPNNQQTAVSVPNYPIQSGKSKLLQDQVKDHPRYEQALPRGDIGPALLKQWEKAKEDCKVNVEALKTSNAEPNKAESSKRKAQAAGLDDGTKEKPADNATKKMRLHSPEASQQPDKEAEVKRAISCPPQINDFK